MKNRLILFLSIISILSFFSCSNNGKKIVTVIDANRGPGAGEESDYNSDYGQLNFSFSTNIFELSDFDTMTNEIMNKLSVSIDPPVKGIWQPVGPNEAAFIFLEKLKPSTLYTVSIDEKKLTTNGKPGIIAYVNGERTDNGKYVFMTRRIEVSSYFISGMKTDLYISLSFNAPVGLPDLTNKLKIENIYGGKPLNYRASYDVLTNTIESNDVLMNIVTTSDRSFIIKPEGLVKAQDYRLKVGSGLNAAEGNLGMLADYYQDFSTYKRLQFKNMSSSSYEGSGPVMYYPDDTILFEFNNPLDKSLDPRKLISSTPTIENESVSIGDNFIYLSGNFIGESKYRFRVNPAVSDIYSQKLDYTVEREISFSHGISIFGVPEGYMVMENYLPPILPMKMRNVSSFKVSYVFLQDKDKITGYLNLKNNERKTFFEKNKISKDHRVKWVWDRFFNYRLDFSSMLKNNSGLLIYRISPRAENQRENSDLDRAGTILFTDLGISVKSGPDSTLVFVRSLKDNSPVEGAAVYELENENKSLGLLTLRGKTDSNGILSFAGDYPSPMVFAEKDGIITLNYGERMNYYYGDEEGYGSGNKNWANIVHRGTDYYLNETNLLLFSDRFLYKPGEKVDVKGIARFRHSDDWSDLPADGKRNEFKFTVNNSRGEEVTNLVATADDWGSLHFSLKIPEKSPTGYYRISWGEYSGIDISVEDFKPAKAEMRIVSSKEIFKWGDTFESDIIGWYLFGAPVIKPIHYSVSASPVTYASLKYPEYNFGQLWWEGGERRDNSFSLVSGIGFPDKSGKIHVEKIIRRDDFKGDAQLMISAETRLDDNSTVYGTKSGINLYNPVHIGILLKDYFVETGHSFNISLVALNENEEIEPDQPVTVQVEKRDWYSYQKAGVNGRLEWEWEMIKTNVFEQTLRLGKAEIPLTLSEPGYYVARAKTFIRGHEGISETDFYVFGKGEVGWMVPNNNEIDLSSDKKEYHTGDTALVLVKNPFQKATALITVEREKIHNVEQMIITDSAAVIPVKITKELVPNAYISVMLFTGRSGTNQVKNDEDLARPNYRIGYINLKVVPDGKKLKVNIVTDSTNYRPGDTARVTIEARDPAGGMVDNAEITVSVADKGILNLVNYELPDPLYNFYGPRELAIYTSEMREYIFGQRYLSEKGEIVGGDGSALFKSLGLGINPRLDFKSSAYYNDKIIISNGMPAEFTFKIPDNLTTWKIMAIAQTKDSSFGNGSAVITASKPLMVLSTLPRFLRINDSVEAGAMIYNYTGRDGNMTAAIEAGGSVNFSGGQSTNIFIPVNSSREVLFRFSVPPQEIHDIKFTLMVKSGTEGDGFVETLPLKNNQNFETMSFYEMIGDAAAKHQKLLVSENILPGSGKALLMLSPSAFTELKGSVDYLVEYPYGCLEQKSSSILPLILGEDIILKTGLLKFKTRDDLRNLVSKVLSEIPGYAGKKGFKYWTDSDYEPNSYLTVYTAFVLTMAKEKGYQIPGDLYGRAVDWVKEYAAGRGALESPGWNYYNALVRSFALYVSALNGFIEPADIKETYLEFTEKVKDDMPAAGFLLKTLSMAPDFTGRGDMIAAITKSFLEKAKISASTAYFQTYNDWDWFYYDNIVSTAVILQALIEAKVQFNDSYKVINWLIQERKGENWLSTHENAMVFWAFNTYLEKFEKDNPNFRAIVSEANKEIINAVFKSRTDRTMTGEYDINSGLKGSLDFTFNKQGAGTLYYFLRFNYLLKKYPQVRNSGLSILKNYYDYGTGKPVENGKFIRGNRYIVKIELTTPADRNFVILDDQLPAGFEPVNLDFATEKNEKKISEGETQNEYWWWGSFEHREQYRDRVLFSAMHLKSGKHIIQYIVRAVAVGNYRVPQIKAEEMYDPEVFGYTYQPDIEVIKE